MLKKVYTIVIYVLAITNAYCSPTICNVSVPFKKTWIAPQQTLVINYKNTENWDAIICGCGSNQQCSTYVATWRYKKQTITSIGPNYLKWLELYLGLPPETPQQNADQNGRIQIYNTGHKAIPISCEFSGLGFGKL